MATEQTYSTNIYAPPIYPTKRGLSQSRSAQISWARVNHQWSVSITKLATLRPLWEIQASQVKGWHNRTQQFYQLGAFKSCRAQGSARQATAQSQAKPDKAQESQWKSTSRTLVGHKQELVRLIKEANWAGEVGQALTPKTRVDSTTYQSRKLAYHHRKQIRRRSSQL